MWIRLRLCNVHFFKLCITQNRLGRPGVDAHAKHEGESDCAVIFLEFLINEGALVTVTADDTLHLWSIRQKTPQVVQSLKFQRERFDY